jgi:hypothetical protein
MIMGMSMIILWLYLNARIKKQKDNKGSIIKQACICAICKHEESKICLQQKCACCIIMKEDTIIGHSNNPLQ